MYVCNYLFVCLFVYLPYLFVCLFFIYYLRFLAWSFLFPHSGVASNKNSCARRDGGGLRGGVRGRSWWTKAKAREGVTLWFWRQAVEGPRQTFWCSRASLLRHAEPEQPAWGERGGNDGDVTARVYVASLFEVSGLVFFLSASGVTAGMTGLLFLLFIHSSSPFYTPRQYWSAIYAHVYYLRCTIYLLVFSSSSELAIPPRS